MGPIGMPGVSGDVVGVRGVLGGWQGSVGTLRPEGIGGMRGHWGSPGGVGAIRGHQRVSGVYWGAGRECRYSRARRGIGGMRGHWGSPRRCRVLGGC